MTLKEAYKKIRESGDETYIEPYEFTWDPDMEDFPLFAKSVLEACKEVIADHDAILAPDKEKSI